MAEDVTIAGSTTVASTVLQPFEAKIEKLAKTTYELRSVGSGNGVLALIAGEADMAAVSAPLADVVRKLNTKNPGSVNGRELVAHEIGAARVAFVVHPTNAVKQLTTEQVTEILSGRITSWSEVGGLNLPIEVFAEPKGGGVRTLVEKTIGKWGDVLAEPTTVQTATQVVFAVSQVPNALGIAASAAVTSSVFTLSTDRPISQPLILVTRGEPTPRMKKLIEAARKIAGGSGAGS